jgi:DNA-directed RNA polymerase subunit K/omega
VIFPTIAELTKEQFNRYELVVGVAKSARIVTDEYVKQRTAAERMVANRETDRPLASLIDSEYRDQKAVKIAIRRLYDGRYELIKPENMVADYTEEEAF